MERRRAGGSMLLLLLVGTSLGACGSEAEESMVWAPPLRMSDAPEHVELRSPPQHVSQAEQRDRLPVVARHPEDSRSWDFAPSWVSALPIEPGEKYAVTVELAEAGELPLGSGRAPGFHLLETRVVPALEPDARTSNPPRLVQKASLERQLEPVAEQRPSTGRVIYDFEFRASARCYGLLAVWNGDHDTPAAKLVRLSLRALPRRWARIQQDPLGWNAPTPLEIHRDLRSAWLAAIPDELVWDVRLPVGKPQLCFAIALVPERFRVWGEQPARFEVHLESRSSPGEVVFQEVLHPEAQPEHHRWQNRSVSLENWSDQQVRLRFVTDTGLSGDTDVAPLRWETAAWSDPTILTEDRKRPSVVLISLDTLRADRLGAYGCPLPISPAIDRLALESVLFETALSTSSFTLPSHASMFSGQHPAYHGVNRNPDGRFSERSRLLTEILRDAGYQTAAFCGGGFVGRAFGFDRGFDVFNSYDGMMSPQDDRIRTQPRVDDPEFNQRYFENHGLDPALDWLRTHHTQPFFLFLHTFVAHSYRPTEEALRAVDPDGRRAGDVRSLELGLFQAQNREANPLTEIELEQARALYDATVWMADRAVDRVLQELQSLGLEERTIVVLTSDHGEEFGEHGGLGHGRTLYEELVRVPMVLRIPGGPRGLRVPAVASLLDLAPTILDLLDIDAGDPVWHGRSLLPAIEGQGWTDRTLLLENRLRMEWRRYALRSGTEKLIWNVAAEEGARLELESLGPGLQPGRDPAAGQDFLEQRFELLKRTLDSYRAEAPRSGASIDPALAEELRQLGYIQDEEIDDH